MAIKVEVEVEARFEVHLGCLRYLGSGAPRICSPKCRPGASKVRC